MPDLRQGGLTTRGLHLHTVRTHKGEQGEGGDTARHVWS